MPGSPRNLSGGRWRRMRAGCWLDQTGIGNAVRICDLGCNVPPRYIYDADGQRLERLDMDMPADLARAFKDARQRAGRTLADQLRYVLDILRGLRFPDPDYLTPWRDLWRDVRILDGPPRKGKRR